MHPEFHKWTEGGAGDNGSRANHVWMKVTRLRSVSWIPHEREGTGQLGNYQGAAVSYRVAWLNPKRLVASHTAMYGRQWGTCEFEYSHPG